MGVLSTVWYTFIGLFWKALAGGFILYGILFLCLLLLKKKNHLKIRQCVIEFIFCCYIAAVMILTGINEITFSSFASMHITPNLVPIVTTLSDAVNNGFSAVIEQVLSNIALYIPFGILVGLLFMKKNKLKAVLLLSFIVSFMVEGLQFFSGRFTDIDDIIWNVAGSALGYLLYVLCVKLFENFKTEKE